MTRSVQQQQVLDFLRRTPWFGRMPHGLQTAMVERAELREFRRGEILYRQGQQSPGLMIILQGQVLLTILFANGTEFLLHIGCPGCRCGDAGLFTARPTVVTATAANRGRLMLLPARAFEELVSEEPSYYRLLAEPSLHRYHMMLRSFAESLVMSPEEFLRARLAMVAQLWREDGYTDAVIEVELSQSAGARLLGVSRQTLNRYLGRLVAEGIIEIGFRTLRILEPDRLRQDEALL